MKICKNVITTTNKNYFLSLCILSDRYSIRSLYFTMEVDELSLILFNSFAMHSFVPHNFTRKGIAALSRNGEKNGEQTLTISQYPFLLISFGRCSMIKFSLFPYLRDSILIR